MNIIKKSVQKILGSLGYEIQKKGFSLRDTFKKLQQKANKHTRRKKSSYSLYTSRVSHHKLN